MARNFVNASAIYRATVRYRWHHHRWDFDLRRWVASGESTEHVETFGPYSSPGRARQAARLSIESTGRSEIEILSQTVEVARLSWEEVPPK